MRTTIPMFGAIAISTLLVGAGVAAGSSSAGHAGTAHAALAAPAMDMSMRGMSPMPAMASGATGRAIASGVAAARINLVIVPDAVMGSNKRTHDAFVPAYITAKVGQQVIVTVYNIDTSPHSFTASALGLNVIVPGAASPGAVATKTFSFTVGKAGTYHWLCILPCDNGGAHAWAMTHDGYMAGTITIQRG